jgi:hypothetical protein
VRLANPDEPDVAAKYKEVFGSSPPRSGFIAVAELDGQIVGIGVLQPIWHIEPFWVAPPMRGRGVFQRLLGLLVPHLPSEVQGVMCYVGYRRLARFLDRLGLEQIPNCFVFRWLRKDVTNG